MEDFFEQIREATRNAIGTGDEINYYLSRPDIYVSVLPESGSFEQIRFKRSKATCYGQIDISPNIYIGTHQIKAIFEIEGSYHLFKGIDPIEIPKNFRIQFTGYISGLESSL